MSFLSPLLLAGAAAIGIPIALHFLFKAFFKPLDWAAMEFLRQSLEQTAKRIKFRELILLLLRCACLLLLALGLARMVVGWGGAGRGESVDAILVFDTSYSLGAKDGGKTRFERAQEAALGVIDNLPTNSTVQIVACSDRATAIPFTPSNLDQARSVVRNLQLTSQAGDLGPGLAEAFLALDRTTGANKEVYVFSDLQRNGLEGSAGSQANDLKARAQVVFVRCGNPQTPIKNIAVLDITFPDAIPHSGTRLPFTVLLKNTGKERVTNIAVSLTVDGTDAGLDTGLAPEIEPGATYPVTMTAALGQPGLRLLTARIGEPSPDGGGKLAATGAQPDDLPGDNRFDKLILVRQRIEVLIVDGRPDFRDPKDSASHYIGNAIVPVADSERDDYFIRTKVVPAELASGERLSDYQIVVLANVPVLIDDKPGIASLEAPFVRDLKKFVEDGGGLIVGSGDFTLPASYNKVLGSGGANLLPFDLAEVVAVKPESPIKPAPDTTETPSFLGRLKLPPFSTATADVDVFSAISANETYKSNTGHALIRFDNGQPMISGKSVGKGEVVFIHTSLDASWTNWTAKFSGASYVGTVRFLLSHLSGKSDRTGNLIAGEKIVWPVPAGKSDFTLQSPEGKKVPLLKPVATEGVQPSLTINDTAQAGDYRILTAGEDPATAPVFAVIPNLRESENLDLLNDTEAELKLGFKPVFVVAGDESDAAGKVRSQREWTIWILLLLFAFACSEALWAWYCGRPV